MLTSVFYYNTYKPYIVGNVSNRGNEVYSPRRPRINSGREASESGSRMFVLNKAMRNEIVNYAQAVSHGVTDLRQATKQTSTSMLTFNQTVFTEGYEYAVNNLSDNLERFTDDYNRSAGFMQSQAHSAGLRAFSHEVTDNVYNNRERLEMLGLTLSPEGNISFSRDQIQGMSYSEVVTAIGENIAVFEDLRSFTRQLMTEPLIEHMRFTGLQYHYNYRLGTMEAEGYSLIEAGMLIDKHV